MDRSIHTFYNIISQDNLIINNINKLNPEGTDVKSKKKTREGFCKPIVRLKMLREGSISCYINSSAIQQDDDSLCALTSVRGGEWDMGDKYNLFLEYGCNMSSFLVMRRWMRPRR